MQDGSDHHQGSRIVRSTGRKDRHSKINTVKGTRDRRVRLSAHTAIQLYDVQDRLGYDQPSKAVDWLLQKAKSAIDALDDSAGPNHPAAALPHEQGIEEEEQSPTYAQWGLQSDPEVEAEDSAFDFQRMQQLENAQNRLGSLQPLQDPNLLEGAFYSPSPLCYDATSLAGCSSDRQFQDMVHQSNWSAGFNSSALNQFCSGSGTLQSNNPMTIRAPSMQPPASIDPRQMSAMALYSSSMSSNELASDKYYGSPFMPHVRGGTEEQGTHSKQHFQGYK